MKHFLKFSVLLLIAGRLYSSTGKYYYYAGTIGKYPIEMTLNRNDQNVITGFYHYIGKGGVLSLQGNVGENNKLTLDEKVYSYVSYDAEGKENDVITGNFHGNFVEGKSVDGEWNSRDGKKKFDFHLVVRCNENGIAFSEGAVKTDSLFIHKPDTVAEEVAEIDYLKVNCGNDSVDKKINQFIFSALSPWSMGEDTYSYAEKTTFPNYKKLCQDFVLDAYNGNFGDTISMESFGTNWDWSSSATVLWNGSGILSFAVEQYAYTGGAHGNYSVSNYSLNLQTGDTISLKNIFIHGYKEPLRKAAVKYLSQDPDFIPRDSLPLNNNFFINPQGICFLYNPYEISSYASGISYAFIPWSEVNKWIDPKGPMGWVKK